MKNELEDMRAYVEVGEGTIEESRDRGCGLGQ